MEKKIGIYSERQYLTLFNLTIIITLGIVIVACRLSPNKTEGLTAILMVLVILVLAILFFYKMEIKMTSSELSVSFGIGLIKKSWKTNDFDFSLYKNIKAPWYYGIGVRVLNDGVLYNAKPGDSIGFFNKETKRYIYIGTKNKDNFESYLIKYYFKKTSNTL